jgi:hypothetical protein
MKNISIIIGLAFLFGCASIKPSSTNTSECTNCPLERAEFWNRWLAVCAPGNKVSSPTPDWSNSTFSTVGKKYDGFKTKDSLDYVAMVDLYPSEEQAQEYLPGVILSGSDYPNKSVVTKGEYLTKIKKIGDDISGYSVYYITPEELERLKKKPSRIEQELGLPLTSNAGVYLVYKMYALDDNVVFQSSVAPSVQYSSPSKAVYWTSGGAMQTLVIDNHNTALWAKDSIALDTLKIQSLPDINQVTSLKE